MFSLQHGAQTLGTLLDQVTILKLLPLLQWTFVFLFLGLTFPFILFNLKSPKTVSEIASSLWKVHFFLGYAAGLHFPDSFQLDVAMRMNSSKWWHVSRRGVCHFSIKYLEKYPQPCPIFFSFLFFSFPFFSFLHLKQYNKTLASRWQSHEMEGDWIPELLPG